MGKSPQSLITASRKLGDCQRCLPTALVGGDHLSVDGSFIEANPVKESRIYPYDLSVNGGTGTVDEVYRI